MWLALLASTAVHAAMPDHVDLDDLSGWEARGFELIDGPRDACWDLTGQLTVDIVVHMPATMFSRGDKQQLRATGNFVGRLDKGEWSAFHFDVTAKEGELDLDVPVFPLVGTIDQDVVFHRSDFDRQIEEALEAAEGADEDEEPQGKQRSVSISVGDDGDGGADSEDAFNMLREVISGFKEGTGIISFAQWNDERGGVELIYDVPMDDSPRAPVVTSTTFFPDGGENPSAVDTVFPKRLTFGEWPARVKIMNMQLRLRGQTIEGQTLPNIESWSALAGLLGFTVGYEQRLVYAEAVECRGEFVGMKPSELIQVGPQLPE